ncbi:type II secretion system minor pseudopilin GspH [Marinobacter sp. CHS3-4]|uniref:type II secretion system minor pseudopilin GspH n=1 Tax=Marinobacter sp. CHS3-4 TaxID=3045174 RepID=UPI0024B596F4|nr:type II secretion system minor pseudopilin GspH [Marinobacter sp. CHS3-4]MDI9245296.1 type II secretion system minor pseudopilin GspH [Marinobacter sp. CHS3-4]
MGFRSPQRSAGFTLIEILVVLVVVGMLVALATFTLGGNSLRRDLDNEAQKLFLLMQTVSEQAIINNTELGLVLEEDAYRFVAYDEQRGSWKPSGERLYRQRKMPEWLVVTEYIENDAPRLASSEDDEIRPDIVLFSSGEATPFELELTLDSPSAVNDDYVHRIVSDGVSPIEWQHPGREASEEP